MSALIKIMALMRVQRYSSVIVDIGGRALDLHLEVERSP